MITFSFVRIVLEQDIKQQFQSNASNARFAIFTPPPPTKRLKIMNRGNEVLRQVCVSISQLYCFKSSLGNRAEINESQFLKICISQDVALRAEDY